MIIDLYVMHSDLLVHDIWDRPLDTYMINYVHDDHDTRDSNMCG